MVYLDASAIVRIVADEPGRAATVAFLRDHETRVTSVVSTVEVPRAVARKRADAVLAAEAFLTDLVVVGLVSGIVSRAATLTPPALRTLDAIHLATALELGRELDAFVTYDTRMGDAARSMGLPVAAP
jgi:predicted nucleic acid-binding protein